MASQTLLGLAGNEPFHWRGDRAYIANFAHLARTLQGMERDLDETELKHLDDYLTSISMTPNPNRALDGSLRATLAGGDPSRGAELFALGTPQFMACATCHASPAGGGAGVFSTATLGEPQPLAVPDLRQAFLKNGFDRTRLDGARGTGFGHDGSRGSLVEFLAHHTDGALGTGASLADRTDLAAFVLSWDTGAHPSIGAQATTDGTAKSRARRDALVALAAAGHSELVAKCVVDGVERGFRMIPGGSKGAKAALASDVDGETTSIAALDAMAKAGVRVTWTLVPNGTAQRWIDRDGDGHLDGDERAMCSDPADPASTPQGACRADIAGSGGVVDGADLAALLGAWGTQGPFGDLDCSGSVDAADAAVLLNAWGACP
jgi:hypothetical protein